MPAETQIITTANGTLSNVAHSIGSVGVSLKSFIVAHPISISIIGGIGIGYYLCNKYKQSEQQKDELDELDEEIGSENRISG